MELRWRIDNNNMTKKVTLDNYKDDKFYPKVVKAVDEILVDQYIVETTEVFIKMGMLERKKMDDWSAGRIPYLEKVLSGSLSKLNRILSVLRFYVHDLNLVSQHNLKKNGKTVLIYSKNKSSKLERAYSLEYKDISKTRKGN